MKKRKTFLSIALLLAVLMLGVGYAAIANINFYITGTAGATANAANFQVKYATESSKNPVAPDVKVAKKSTIDTSEYITATATYTDDTHATLEISGMKVAGDKVVATYTVLNESPDLKAYLTFLEKTITTNSAATENEADATKYFDVTVTSAADSAEEAMSAANGLTTVVVTVELKETPINNVGISITIPFDAVPVEN